MDPDSTAEAGRSPPVATWGDQRGVGFSLDNAKEGKTPFGLVPARGAAGVSNGTAQIARREFPSERSQRVPQSCVVFTPRPLADAIVVALGDLPRSSWLEPCVGGGVFLQSLKAANVPQSRIRALDLDGAATEHDVLAKTLRGQEFLGWSLRTSERFARIIANPPYIALNRMPKSVQRAALKIEIPGTDRCVTMGANCWFAFLCASISLLSRGGGLAFLLPAAWEYSDYSAPLRASITHLFERVEVHRSRQPLFRMVQEGSTVLLARGYFGIPSVQRQKQRIRHLVHKTPAQLIEALRFSAPTPSLNGMRRVVRIATDAIDVASERRRSERERQQPASVAAQSRLGDILQIRLGGVTGDAGYFVLSENQRVHHGLPRSACRPVVSRAHHLTAGKISSADWSQLRDDDERVWLFNPTLSQVALAPVKRYLKLKEEDGGCNLNALKVRSRDPWYRTPLQPAIDGFMSGMSSWGPWVVFREMPRLAATNTLYVVRFLKSEDADERAGAAMWLLTTEAADALRRIGRRYADGLLKFEPGDIAELPMRTPSRTRGAYQAYLGAVRLLLKGHKSQCHREADTWFP